MVMAIAAVEHGESIRSASERYSVPRATLHDYVSGRVQFGAKSGPKPYLTPEEESELVNCVLELDTHGHTKSQILGLVQQITDKKGIVTDHVTNGWWERSCN